MRLDASDDPFLLEYSKSIHTKRVTTIAARPPTIPQYTSDIHHALARLTRESFLLTHPYAAGRYTHFEALCRMSARALASLLMADRNIPTKKIAARRIPTTIT